jgi:hypothetical protein
MVEPLVSYLESTVPAPACARAILVRSTGCACMRSMAKVDRRCLAVGFVVGGQWAVCTTASLKILRYQSRPYHIHLPPQTIHQISGSGTMRSYR